MVQRLSVSVGVDDQASPAFDKIAQSGTAATDAIAKGANQAAAAVDNLGKSTDGNTAAQDRSTKQYAALTAQLQRMYEPATLYTAQLQKQQALITAMAPTEEIRIKQLAQATALFTSNVAAVAAKRAADGAATEAATGLNVALNLTGQNLQIAEHVARSFTDSLAAGASVTQAAGREAGRLAQILPTVFGGTTLTTVLGYAAGVGSIVAVYAAAASSASNFATQQRAFDTALAGSGSLIGATGAQLADLAQSVSAAGGVTANEARQIVLSLAQIGTSGAVLGPITQAARDFGAATGTDAAQGALSLAKALKDPQTGLATLNDMLHFSDAALAEYVRDQTAAGNADAARTAILDALGRKVQGVADNQLSALGKALKGAGDLAAYLYDNLAKVAGLRVPTVPEQIKALQSQIADAQGAGGSVPTSIFDDNPNPLSNSGAAVSDLQSQLQPLLQQNTDDIKEAQLAANTVALKAAQAAAVGLADSYDTVAAQSRALDAQIATLNKTLASLDPQNQQSTKLFEDLSRGIQILQSAQAGLRSSFQDSSQSIADQNKILSASIGDRAAVAAQVANDEAKRKDIAGKNLDDIQVEIQAEDRAKNSKLQLTQGIRDQTAELVLNNAQTQKVSAAYLVSSAAGIQADALRTAEYEHQRDALVDVNQRTQDLIQNGFNKAYESGTKLLPTLVLTTAEYQALAAASAGGTAALNDQIIANQALQQVAAQRAAADAVTDAAKHAADEKEVDDLQKQIETELHLQSVAQQTKTANLDLEAQRDQLAILQAQVDTLGELPDEQARYVAQLQEAQTISKTMPGIAYQTKLALIAGAGAAADLGAQLQEAKQITGQIGDAIASGIEEGGKKGIASFEDALERALIELAKNLLLTPLIQPIVFDAIGSLSSSAASAAAGASGSSSGGSGSLLSNGSSLVSGANTLSGGSLYSSLGNTVNSYGSSIFGFGTANPGTVELAAGSYGDGAIGLDAAAGATQTGSYGGLTATGALGAVGGGLSAAFAGYELGTIFAAQNSGSKLSATAEAGTTGAIAGAIIGSVVPVLGTAAGAIIGGAVGTLAGLLLPGATVGPNSATSFDLNKDGTVGVYGARSDNGGDQAQAVAAGTTIASAINTFTQAIGGTISSTGGKVGDAVGNIGGHYYSTYAGQETDYQDAQSAQVDYILRLLKGSTYAGVSDPNITTAIKNSSATSIDGLASDAQFGANFDQTLKALNGTFGVVDQTVATAKTSIDGTVASLKAFEDQTTALGLPIDQAKAAVDSYLDSLIGLRPAVVDTAYQDTIKSANAEFAELQTQLVSLGYTADQAAAKVGAGLTATIEKINSDYAASVDQQDRAALGQDYIDSLQGIATNIGTNRADITAAGRDPNKLENDQLDAELSNLNLSQAQTALSYFANADQTVAAAIQRRIAALNAETDATNAATDAANAAAAAQAQISAGGDIAKYLTGLVASTSPTAGLATYSSQYDSDLALAKGGDADALKAITNDAQALLQAGQAVYASGPAQQALIAYVEQTLSALPATESYDAQQLTKLTNIAAIEAASGDTLDSLLTLEAADTQSKLIVGTFLGVGGDVATAIENSGTGTASAVIAALYAGNAADNQAVSDQTEALRAASAAAGAAIGLDVNGTTGAVADAQDALLQSLGLNIGAVGGTTYAVGDTTKAVLSVLSGTGTITDALGSNGDLYGALGIGNNSLSNAGTLLGDILSYTQAISDPKGELAGLLAGLPGSFEQSMGLSDLALENALVGLGNELGAGLNDIVKAINAIPPASVTINTAAGTVTYPEDPGSSKSDTGYATGGLVIGPGTGTSDSVPAMLGNQRIKLSNREFVSTAAATQRNLGTLVAMNNGYSPDQGHAAVVGAVQDMHRGVTDGLQTLHDRVAKLERTTAQGNLIRMRG